MQRILESHPNHHFLLEVPELWVLDSTVEYPFSPVAAFFLVTTFMCTNFLTGGVCLIAHSFHLLNSRCGHMSAATRKMQKQLIINMLLQLCIPFISLTFPWWIGGIIIGFDIEVPQAVPKLFFIINGCHAIISSLEIIYLTKPYREFILGLFWPKKTHPDTSVSIVSLRSSGNHVCAILFELFLHLVVPEWFIPPLCYRFHGLLGGLGPNALMIIGSALLMMVAIGVACCFVYRHRQLLHAGHWARFPPWLWTLLLACLYLVLTGAFTAMNSMAVFTQDTDGPAMQGILKRYKNWQFLSSVPDIWLSDAKADSFDSSGVSAPIAFFSLLCICMITYSFVAWFLIGHSLYLLNSHLGHMSDATRRMHKILLKNMFLQLFIPFLTMSIPWTTNECAKNTIHPLWGWIPDRDDAHYPSDCQNRIRGFAKLGKANKLIAEANVIATDIKKYAFGFRDFLRVCSWSASTPAGPNISANQN
ncbi:unnamed protein product, partial [Mesorhabditis spiculigera]